MPGSAFDRGRWEANLGFLTNNTRFLVLPWVAVPHPQRSQPLPPRYGQGRVSLSAQPGLPAGVVRMIGYEQALAVCRTDPEAAARMLCEFARELSPVEGGGRHAESRERRPAPRLPIPARQVPGAGGKGRQGLTQQQQATVL